MHRVMTDVISREIGDRRGAGQDLGNLGSAYAALGELSRARTIHSQSFALSLSLGELPWITFAAAQLVSTLFRIEDYRTACVLAMFACANFKEMGYPQAEAAGNLVGICAKELGKKEYEKLGKNIEKEVEALFMKIQKEYPVEDSVDKNGDSRKSGEKK